MLSSMRKVPVAAIFDVGKTNKKLFLFNEQYEIVHESQAVFAEMEDEDGDLCDDLGKISSWIKKDHASGAGHAGF